MIRRTSRRSERLHLLDEERNQRAGVLYPCFCLLIEVRLVGRAAALDNAEELVLHALRCLDVNLCGQVAACVHLLVHREGSVLRVAQVLFGVCLVHSFRQSFFVAEARPHLLSLLAVDDCRAGILAERQLSLASHLGVAQECQCHILVVVARFGVSQYFSHLLVVSAAQQKVDIPEGRVGKHRQRFRTYFEDRFALEFANRHAVFGQEIVLRVVFARLKHGGVLEIRCCHNVLLKVFDPPQSSPRDGLGMFHCRAPPWHGLP